MLLGSRILAPTEFGPLMACWVVLMLHGKRDFTDVVKVKTGSLSLVTQVVTMQSRKLYGELAGARARWQEKKKDKFKA